MSEELDKLITLSAQLPKRLRADWEGTNHFELQDVSHDAESLFWLDVSEMFSGSDGPWDQTDEGRRVGLVLNCVAALSNCQDELAQLREKLADVRKALSDSVVALDDWLHVHAPQECKDEHVAETRERLSENGVVWYIATLQQSNRKALAIIDGDHSEDPRPMVEDRPSAEDQAQHDFMMGL